MILHFFLFSSIPPYLRWTKWISWFYYGFDALAVNQWRNVAILDCTDTPPPPPPSSTSPMTHAAATATTTIMTMATALSQSTSSNYSFGNDNIGIEEQQQQQQQQSSGQMCFKNGQDVLQFLSLGIQPEWLDFFGILSLMILLRFFAYLTLLFIARKR